MRKTPCFLVSAALLSCMLTACGPSTTTVSGGGAPAVTQEGTTVSAETTAPEVSAADSTFSDTGTAAVTDAPAATDSSAAQQTTAPVTTAASAAVTTAAPPADPAAAELCGKWEIESCGRQSVCTAQYGTEEYCRLYQMEIFADSTVKYYDRTSGSTVSGTWTLSGSDTVEIQFTPSADAQTFPLDSGNNKLTLANNLLVSKAKIGGLTVIFRKTDVFTERVHPETGWFAGTWECDALPAAPQLPAGTALTGLQWDVYVIEDSMLISASLDGGQNWQLYYAAQQTDGSFTLAQEFPDGSEQYFENSVIRRTGEKVEWTITGYNLGTVTMHRTSTV